MMGGGRAFLSSSLITMMGVGCAFLAQLLLARLLPADAYGGFSFVYSLSLLISIFAVFGFQNSLVRLIAGEQRGADIRMLVRFAFFFTVVLALLAGALVFGVVYLAGYADVYGVNSFVIGVVLVAAFAGLRIGSAVMRGFGRSAFSVLYESGLREIFFMLGIAVVLLCGWSLESGEQALLVFLVAACVAAVVGLVHSAFQVVRFSVGDAQCADFGNWRDWLRLSFPMMLVVIAQRVMRRSDVVILGFLVSPAWVGAYAIATQFADVGAVGQKAVFAVFGPQAAAFYKAGDVQRLRSAYGRARWYGIGITAAASVCIAVGAPYVLALFGEGYGAGYSALLILLVGQFVNMCFGPVALLMIMSAYEREAMRTTMMMAAANIIFNPLAILYWGLEGAATVTAICIVVRGLANFIMMKRRGVL